MRPSLKHSKHLLSATAVITVVVGLSLGIGYWRKGQHDTAIPSRKVDIRIELDDVILSWKRAIRIKPDDAAAHIGLGMAYEKKGAYYNAIVALKEATRINPDYGHAHYNLGRVYEGAGQNASAIASFKEALRIAPYDAQSHYYLGVLYLKEGKNASAIASLKRAIHFKRNFAQAHYTLGVAYGRLAIRNREAAVKQYELLKELNPDMAKQLSGLINDKQKNQ